jgi:hypothetical protein
MLTLPNKTLRRLAKAGHWFAVGLGSALLAAMGAWPTPGLFGDRESRRPEQETPS